MRMSQQARLIQILSSQVQRPHRPLLPHIPMENHFGQPPDHNTSLVDENLRLGNVYWYLSSSELLSYSYGGRLEGHQTPVF